MFTSHPVRLGLFALAAGLISLGQAKGQPRYSINHQSWSTEAGLPQNSVHQILQSQDGFLWVATEGGAVRYDGFSFKVLNRDTDPAFTSSDTSSLAEDAHGNLWIGTADGIVEYTSTHAIHFGQSEGLPAVSIASIASSDDGSVLVLTSGGLARFDGRRFQVVQAQPASVDHIQRQADGSVVLLGKSGTFVYRHGSISRFSIPTSLDSSAIRGVLKQANGSNWVWTDREVQGNLPGGRVAWQVGRDVPGTRIQAVAVDRSGRAWVGTNRGLVALTPGKSPESVRDLEVDSVLSILEDTEGNLWIGTDTSGLHTLRRRTFYQQAGLADEELSCLAEASDHSIWIGTREDGLRRVRSGSATGRVDQPVKNEVLTSPIILSLAPGLKGDMWVGTPDGLTHVTPSGSTSRYTSSDGLPDDLVRSLLVSRDGSVWIGTRRGLAHFQSGHFDVFTAAEGLGTNLIGPLYESKDGDLWIGTLSGVSRLHAGEWRTYGASGELGRGPVTGITEDESGHVWVSTEGAGVLLWDGSRFRAVAAGAIRSDIYSLIADGHGFLWLRGRRSIIRTSAQYLAKCASESDCQPLLTTYAAADGMPSEEFIADSRPSMWRSSSGELWMATRKGVAVANAAFLSLNEIAPPVVIESFSADNKEVPGASGVPSLPSARARYTFEYAGLSYTIPSKVQYRTKLEGFDSDWSSPTTRRNASYTNLPPGKYTFRVRAANNDGVWNLTGAHVEFRILPPFYRTWWFLLALTVALGCLGLLIYRFRMRRVRLRFEAVLAERGRIAREIHDTLAQDLVGISVQLNLVSQLLDSGKLSEATQQLTLTRKVATEGIEEARQSIWNLRATTGHLDLPSKMTALANRYSTNSLAVRTRVGGAYRELPNAIEDQVLRIMQEAITNARRHASAAEVNVDCQYGHDKLIVKVKDDGRGFTIQSSVAENGHFGLQGMRERAATIGGELNVRSEVGEGTLVELVVPIGQAKGSD